MVVNLQVQRTHSGELAKVIRYSVVETNLNSWHQDVKPSNILVKSCGGQESIYHSKFMLADLGLSHFCLSDKNHKDVEDKDSYGTYTYGRLLGYRSSVSHADAEPQEHPKLTGLISMLSLPR